MSTTYKPQPGTIAYRVVEHLRTLGPNVEVTSPVLLEVIGQPSDWGGLNICMESAVQHGLVAKRVEGGRRAYWRIAGERTAPGVDSDRAPAPLEDHTAIDDPEANSRPRVATAAESVMRVKAKPEIGAPACDRAPAGEASQPSVGELAETLTEVVDAEFVEVAISNTGRLLISNGTQRIALSPEQTEKVFEYIDAHRGIEWQEAV